MPPILTPKQQLKQWHTDYTTASTKLKTNVGTAYRDHAPAVDHTSAGIVGGTGALIGGMAVGSAISAIHSRIKDSLARKRDGRTFHKHIGEDGTELSVYHPSHEGASISVHTPVPKQPGSFTSKHYSTGDSPYIGRLARLFVATKGDDRATDYVAGLVHKHLDSRK